MAGVYRRNLVGLGTSVVCPELGKLRHRTKAGSVTALVKDQYVQVSVPKRVPIEVKQLVGMWGGEPHYADIKPAKDGSVQLEHSGYYFVGTGCPSSPWVTVKVPESLSAYRSA